MDTADQILATLDEARLEPMGTLVATLGERHVMEGAPFGTRMVVDVRDLRITGPDLDARMAGTAAADWGSIGAGGTFQADVRVTVRTHDGALILVQYNGRWDLSDPAAPGPVFRPRGSRPATSATRGSTACRP